MVVCSRADRYHISPDNEMYTATAPSSGRVESMIQKKRKEMIHLAGFHWVNTGRTHAHI